MSRETIRVVDITAEWLAQQLPEVAAALEQRGREALVAQLTEVAQRNQGELATLLETRSGEAADAERDRILGIQEHACEGAAEVIAACIADRSVTPDAAAGRVMKHLRGKGNEALDRLRKTEPPNPPSPSAEEDGNEGRMTGLIDAGRRLGLVREEG